MPCQVQKPRSCLSNNLAFSCAILLGAGMPALQYSVGVRFYLLRLKFEIGHSKYHTILIYDKKFFYGFVSSKCAIYPLFEQNTITNTKRLYIYYFLLMGMKLLSIKITVFFCRNINFRSTQRYV